MLKSVRILAMAAAAALLAAPCALAIDTVVLKVEIPFDFMVGNEQLPSGEYRIVQATNGHVRIYSRTDNRVATVLCVPERFDVEKGWQLMFQKRDGQHYLKSIGAAEGLGLAVPQSRTERATTKAAGGTVVATR